VQGRSLWSMRHHARRFPRSSDGSDLLRGFNVGWKYFQTSLVSAPEDQQSVEGIGGREWRAYTRSEACGGRDRQPSMRDFNGKGGEPRHERTNVQSGN
jgi:hypothetical protein